MAKKNKNTKSNPFTGCTIVVTGKPGSKLAKAKEMGIPILTEQFLFFMDRLCRCELL